MWDDAEQGRTSEQRQRTVLLVEDDADVRELTTAYLRKAGHMVMAAGNAADALVASKSHGPIDVLLTDLRLPGVSGAELSRSITAHKPDVGVVYISGMPQDHAARMSIWQGGAVFVPKPFNRDDLLSAVERSLYAAAR